MAVTSLFMFCSFTHFYLYLLGRSNNNTVRVAGAEEDDKSTDDESVTEFTEDKSFEAKAVRTLASDPPQCGWYMLTFNVAEEGGGCAAPGLGRLGRGGGAGEEAPEPVLLRGESHADNEPCHEGKCLAGLVTIIRGGLLNTASQPPWQQKCNSCSVSNDV